MKTIKAGLLFTIVLFTFQTSFAQSGSFSEIFKQHFNETVQKVEQAESADEKRTYLNDSFDDMLTAIERIERSANLSDDEQAQLISFKEDVEERKSELNGLDGFDEIVDEDLDDFSNFSQQMMEQANRTVTISLTSALLIVLILLLL
ncbi:hypothetical protein DYD21_15145 [Rhodohalobacter sp. SW132]|uniref:hypothetical protein n=1 Tax=Rhodohalobacter sp. SW132 TaxID=2293433 RepID=UPI000E250819|nr:hypothetical protein [Rhodohalobacter sp. SW132]REL29185.1 hypothetical protein DYD21_15145 [Rhodohalobacter sp. SW132]